WAIESAGRTPMATPNAAMAAASLRVSRRLTPASPGDCSFRSVIVSLRGLWSVDYTLRAPHDSINTGFSESRRVAREALSGAGRGWGRAASRALPGAGAGCRARL